MYQVCMDDRMLALSYSGNNQEGKTRKTFAVGSFRIFLHYILGMIAYPLGSSVYLEDRVYTDCRE